MRNGVRFAAGWIFSVYSAAVTVLCNLATWPLLLLTPGADRRRVVARAGTMMIFRLTGIGLSVEGRDRIPDGPCIVVANHRSYFDGLALICGLPAGFSPMIKDGIRRAPFLGFIMARAGALYVRRTPAAAAGVDTLGVIRRVRAGVSPAIFAEGTLSPDAGLLPLREGASLIAVRTGLPVVPLAIQGSKTVLPQGGRRFHRGRVRVTIGDPLFPRGRDRTASVELRDRVEHALWRLLSPETADWRSHLDAPEYYARALEACRLPATVVDLDSVAACLRRVLGPVPSKPLRLDARTLTDPALVLRIWRSNVCFAGVVFDCVDVAATWLCDQAFENALIAPPSVDARLAERITALACETRSVALAVGGLDELATLQKSLELRQTSMDVWLRIDYDGLQPEDALAQDLKTFIQACASSSTVRAGGVFIEPRRSMQNIGSSDGSPALLSFIQRAAEIAGCVAVLGSTTPNRVQRSHLVSEIVVGQEIEAAHSPGEHGWLFAGQARRESDGIALEPTHASALNVGCQQRIDLYGGAVAAERAWAGSTVATATAESSGQTTSVRH